MSAKILSYSRSPGIFAGVSLGGATLRNDLDSIWQRLSALKAHDATRTIAPRS